MSMILLVLLLVLPMLAIIIRHKWLRAQARSAEVKRRAYLVALETQRIEIEARQEIEALIRFRSLPVPTPTPTPYYESMPVPPAPTPTPYYESTPVPHPAPATPPPDPMPVFGEYGWAGFSINENDQDPLLVNKSDSDLATPVPVYRSESAPVSVNRTLVNESESGRFCAVCKKETVLRCKQCKAVKYCSFKCQTIDWRGGHKDTCHPPKHEKELGMKISNPNLKSDNVSPEKVAPDSSLDSQRPMKTETKTSFSGSDKVAPDKKVPLERASSSSHLHKNDAIPYEESLPPDWLFTKLFNENVELQPFGLVNIGNSCYANVVFQCLMFTRPLRTFLQELYHRKTCHINKKRGWCLLCQFENLVYLGKQGKPQSLRPILSELDGNGARFGKNEEEDAHEFLRYVIDKLHSICINDSRVYLTDADRVRDEPTIVELTFGGYLLSKIRCKSCHESSERIERMLDLTLDIHGDISTLEQALEQFTKSEILDGNNRYKCNRCNSYQRARKQMTISEAPNVLTIALKRYQAGDHKKIAKLVEYPKILNLHRYMSPTSKDTSPVYHLYAVVVHKGVMNASGHYICYVEDTHGQWYEVNDNEVKQVTFEKVLSQCAYMLFYARYFPRAPSLVHPSRTRRPNIALHNPGRGTDEASDTSSLLTASDVVSTASTLSADTTESDTSCDREYPGDEHQYFLRTADRVTTY